MNFKRGEVVLVTGGVEKEVFLFLVLEDAYVETAPVLRRYSESLIDFKSILILSGFYDSSKAGKVDNFRFYTKGLQFSKLI